MADVATKNGPRSGAKSSSISSCVDPPARRAPGPHRDAAQRAVRAELGAGDVGARLAQHLLARSDQAPDGEHVGHRAGRCEQRGLVPEHPRDPLLERAHGGVLAVHVVADLGRGHGAPHRVGRAGDGVAAEVDHADNLLRVRRCAASGDEERELQRLDPVEARVAHRLVPVGEPGLAEQLAAADALGDVVTGELDVDAAGPGAERAVDVEEALHLLDHVVEVAGLVAGGGLERVAVHRVAHPGDLHARRR